MNIKTHSVISVKHGAILYMYVYVIIFGYVLCVSERMGVATMLYSIVCVLHCVGVYV